MEYQQILKDVLEARKNLAEGQRKLSAAKKAVAEVKQTIDRKTYQEAAKKPVFKILQEYRSNLDDMSRNLEKLYIHWFLSKDESWDFDDYNPELESQISPVREDLETAIIKMEKVCENIIEKTRNSIAKKLKEEELLKIFKQTECDVAKLQEENNKAYERMIESLRYDPKLILQKHKIELIKEFLNSVFGEKDIFLTPIIDEDKILFKIDFEHSDSFTGWIDEEEYDDEGQEIKDGLENKLAKLFEIFDHNLSKVIDCKTIYNIVDIDITDGSKFESEGSYDRDTGFGTPFGEFYCGDVTAAGTIEIIIII